jgi:hypothetical protein
MGGCKREVDIPGSVGLGGNELGPEPGFVEIGCKGSIIHVSRFPNERRDIKDFVFTGVHAGSISTAPWRGMPCREDIGSLRCPKRPIWARLMTRFQTRVTR